jgi:hypothetical protein
MLTGTVTYVLHDAERGRMRSCWALLNDDVPPGARVMVDVGGTRAEPESVRALARHERRLQVDVHGTAHAVRRWVAIRTTSTRCW